MNSERCKVGFCLAEILNGEFRGECFIINYVKAQAESGRKEGWKGEVWRDLIERQTEKLGKCLIREEADEVLRNTKPEFI